MSDQEPGPYVELVSRIAQLETAASITERTLAILDKLTERQGTPELTVRLWRGSHGAWQYETTVTLKPESAEAMPNTLAWVDQMARAEAQRRNDVDESERKDQRHG